MPVLGFRAQRKIPDSLLTARVVFIPRFASFSDSQLKEKIESALPEIDQWDKRNPIRNQYGPRNYARTADGIPVSRTARGRTPHYSVYELLPKSEIWTVQ